MRHLREIIAATVLTIAVPALATGTGIETRVVRVDPASLRSAPAIRRLTRHIADAALEVCGASPYSATDMKTAIRASRCWQDSYAGGIAQLNDIGRTDLASLPPSRGTARP